MRWYTLVALGVIVLVYLVVGGIIFSAIESPNEAVVRTQMLQEIQSFLDQNTCLNVTDIAVINGLINAMNDGGLTINLTGQLVNQTRWDIRTALFISLELIATIGFPTAAPASPGGKAFTVPYAIFGIPLFLATAIGMGMLLNRLAELIRVSVIKRCKGRHTCAADCGETLYRTTLIAFWGIVFFVVIPSIIFANIEPWTYGDAFYFTFTTLATIGFGDMIPSYSDPRLVPWMSDNYRNWYRLAIAFWILLMSAWFAGVLVSIQMTITKAALTAEDRIVRKSREATANHVSSNVYVRPQSAMEMAPPVTPPYHVRSPISAVSSDVSNAQAYGDVTRVVV